MMTFKNKQDYVQTDNYENYDQYIFQIDLQNIFSYSVFTISFA